MSAGGGPGSLAGLRVDVVGSSRELFGSDRSAVRVAKILQGSGALARLVLPSHRPELGLEQFARSQGVPTANADFAVATSRGLENHRAVWPRRSRWPGGTPDVLVVNTTAVVLPRLRAPALLTVREWMDPARVSHRALATLQGGRARGVVGISNGVNAQWTETAMRSPAPRLIWNWLDDAWMSPSHGASDVGGDILFLGRFNSWKGQDMLGAAYIQAFGSLPRGEQPRLTFLGAEASPSPFARLADELRVKAEDRNWAVLGAVSAPRAVLEQHSLLVVPSLRPEPFGNVLLEGVAAGCKVLAFPGGGPADLSSVFPGVVGVVERDQTALANSLARWWADGGKGQTPAEKAACRSEIERSFTSRRAQGEWAAAISHAVAP